MVGRRSAVVLLLVAGCSTGGSTGGSCKAIAVCATLPLSQVNAALSKTSSTATPHDAVSGPETVDNCEYTGGMTTGIDAKFLRVCYTDASMAAGSFQGDHDKPASMGQTKMDVPGLGDKAYFVYDPVLDDFHLDVVKGNTILVLTVNKISPLTPAQEVQALTPMANALLSAK